MRACVWFYLTGVKLEKSAQPVSAFEWAEEFQPVSAGAGGGADGTAALAGVDAAVSIGMSSKLAVHTGPWKIKDAQVTPPAVAETSQTDRVDQQQATASTVYRLLDTISHTFVIVWPVVRPRVRYDLY